MKTLAIVTTWLVAGAALADPASDAAAKAEEGKKAFAENRYADAIAAFRAANELVPDPKLIYAIAQAQRMAGDCAAAVTSYEEFIKTKADDKLVEYSQANITRCKEQLAKEQPVQPVEPVKPVEPAQPVAQPLPPPPPPREQPASWTGDWLGHGLVVGGVIATALGIVVWSGGRGDAAAVGDATTHEEFLAARDAADGAVTRQRIGLGLAVAGLALVGIGVYHYTTIGTKEVRVGAAPAEHGGTVFAGWSF